MTITALPTPPSPSDSPAAFNTKAFDLLGALPTFVTEANGLEAENAAAASAAATSAANAVLASKLNTANPSYTGTLTGGTGVVNLGYGQFVKDAAGNVEISGQLYLLSRGVTQGLVMPDWRMYNAGSNACVWNNGSDRLWLTGAGNVTPGADNTQTMGAASYRWSTVYAGTGTINTSDAREKTHVRVMAADEIEAAKALSKEIGVYQFLASVEAKGDKARHHIGMTVQRAIEVMQHHGLDPFSYGFICYDKWDEETKEHPAVEAREAIEAVPAVMDGEGIVTPAVEAQPAIEAKDAWTEVTQQAGDRYSFRYDQLTLFIARGIDARLAALESA